MVRYGMAIDLGACIGCNACTLACKQEHATPPGIFWGRVMEEEVGHYPNTRRLFLPVLCNHCKEPACREVCPSGATYKREDGIVLIDYEKCIGCRACIAACPYMARYFMEESLPYYADGPTPYEVHFQNFQEGVVQKCTFCVERLARGLEPACVQTCPTSCRYFGDLEDPRSAVSVFMKGKKALQLLPEQGTDPSVFYTE